MKSLIIHIHCASHLMTSNSLFSFIHPNVKVLKNGSHFRFANCACYMFILLYSFFPNLSYTHALFLFPDSCFIFSISLSLFHHRLFDLTLFYQVTASLSFQTTTHNIYAVGKIKVTHPAFITLILRKNQLNNRTYFTSSRSIKGSLVLPLYVQF